MNDRQTDGSAKDPAQHEPSGDRWAEATGRSLHETTERRFTDEGARAGREATNPYKFGSAAATWWQRGHDSVHAKG